MVYTIGEIVSYLETIAPPAYQEAYDNARLITGNKNENITGVLCTLDCTEDVVREAISKKCNLIIAHHPIVFKGLKSFTGQNYVERTIVLAIKNDIAIYAIHTNLDHVSQGVNQALAEKLELINTKILQPKTQILTQLVTYVPVKEKDRVLQALFAAGAGEIGEYSNCSFVTEGQGTFLPSENANPAVGEKGKLETQIESKIEVILPAYLESKVLKALVAVHPYEEVAYQMYAIKNKNQYVGAGIIGELPVAMDEKEFLLYLKKQLNLTAFKHTALKNQPVERIALCGGAGIFLLDDAKKMQADFFITSDIKYHEFFDAENQLVICDIGHYESEIHTKELIFKLLSTNFTNIALYLSNIVTNPITYQL
jgi:dinuclear metal center YbgI/SA1388 family protein